MSMAANPRLAASPAQGPAVTFPAQVRDALAVRLTRYQERYPDVLDLLAEVLVALHDELHGSAAALAGTNSASHFREVLRGERDLAMRDVLRLFLSPHPKAQAAADRVLSLLEGARSRALALDAHEALAQVTEAHGDLSAELARDLRDGKLSPAEGAGLLPEIAALEAKLERLKATAARALGDAA